MRCGWVLQCIRYGGEMTRSPKYFCEYGGGDYTHFSPGKLLKVQMKTRAFWVFPYTQKKIIAST